MTITKTRTADTQTAVAQAWAEVHRINGEIQALPEALRAAADHADAVALHRLMHQSTALAEESRIAQLVVRQREVEHGTAELRRAYATVEATKEAGTAAYAEYNKGFGKPSDAKGAVSPPPTALVAWQRAQEAVGEAQTRLSAAQRMKEEGMVAAITALSQP